MTGPDEVVVGTACILCAMKYNTVHCTVQNSVRYTGAKHANACSSTSCVFEMYSGGDSDVDNMF